jgi:hypothetical protein
LWRPPVHTRIPGASQSYSYQPYTYSNNLSVYSQQIGGSTFYNIGGLSGYSQQLGSFSYSNFSNGLTGFTQVIGNTTYGTYSNGSTCTTQVYGVTLYTQCY